MGIAFAISTALCWSLYNFAIRRGRLLMDPGAGYLLTMVVNVAANGLFLMLPLLGRGAPGFAWLPVAFFALSGLSTTLIGRWFLFQSVFRLGPSRASAWKNIAPVYTLILGAIFLHEPITLMAVVGMAIALAGTWALARDQGNGQSAGVAGEGGGPAGQRLGMVFAALSGLAFSLGFLLRRAGLLIWPAPVWGNAMGAAAALAVWLPFAAGKGELALLLRARGEGLRFWLVAGLLSSLAQLFTYVALTDLPSAITQVITSLEPVFTMGLSLLLLGSRERLTGRLALSVAAICLGVALVVL